MVDAQRTIELPPDPPDPRAVLTPREIDVLALASQGLTNGQVASRLQLSVHAVKFHLASIYRKLGVGNRTEAAVMYLRATSEVDGRAAIL
jgi:DNA-binding CsgD family transcriptional regulator